MEVKEYDTATLTFGWIALLVSLEVPDDGPKGFPHQSPMQGEGWGFSGAHHTPLGTGVIHRWMVEFEYRCLLTRLLPYSLTVI